MKYLFILPLTLFLVSCQGKNPNETIASADSTSTESSIALKPLNVGEISTYKGTYDVSKDPDAENEVLKGLSFGISESQYKKNEKKYLSQYEDDEVYGYHIGDFGFYNLTPYFNNNELYRVDINGFNKLNYNELLQEIDVVKNIYSNKYGSPIYEANPPKDNELPSNEGICIAEWKAGKKVIQLCFFDFTKAAHSNLLKIVIFRSDKMQSKQDQEEKKKEAYSNANTEMI